MSLPTDTLAKLYTVPQHRKKGSKKCNGHSVNTSDKMTNLIKNMYISSIYYNKIITIVNNKWNAVEHCTSYKICTANIFFSRLRIVHSCKFLLNVSSMYGMCFVWYKWQLLKKFIQNLQKFQRNVRHDSIKYQIVFLSGEKKEMEEICILKLNPENIGHLTLQ